jgi:hypothetical protein
MVKKQSRLICLESMIHLKRFLPDSFGMFHRVWVSWCATSFVMTDWRKGSGSNVDQDKTDDLFGSGMPVGI